MATHNDQVRRFVYQFFVDRQRAPQASEIAAALGISFDSVTETLGQLAHDRLLVLDVRRTGILMAEPFSAVETPFRVESGERAWWANCAWDALGIAAALHADVRILSACPDCGHPLTVTVTANEVAGDQCLIHLAVPAANWWDDIVFT